ncbi:hypothetical protein [Plantactinospora sp. KLBMP9567]|uniref:hypothetical protein n=1 Tax=Plantactinospora sp. KLBMP9567 TaxID=3085900 RepID=UPI002981C429|nr:hypothetical protein [Plantactinospora sp. KLBMP9567]MDW5327842.1 hypothetical protein [Plantactinospora sp. KLBMP9567]
MAARHQARVPTATARASSSTGPACGRRPACHIPSMVPVQDLRSTHRSASRAIGGRPRSARTAPASTPTVGVAASSGSIPRAPSGRAPASGEEYCRSCSQPSTARATSATSSPARCAIVRRLGRDRLASSPT